MVEAHDACREAMEELVDSGLVRHLGVSNFSVKQVEELLECARIKPVANQVELHPFLPQRKLVGVCARKVYISDCRQRQFVQKAVKATEKGVPTLIFAGPSQCVCVARTGPQIGSYYKVYISDPRGKNMLND